jgi:aspartate kinase
MRKRKFMTSPIDCAPSEAAKTASAQETEFEKPRGVRRVETRTNYTQVHVHGLKEPVMDARLKVLAAVAEANVSIDFMKLTPDGLSFLVTADKSDSVDGALRRGGVAFELRKDRSIVLVHAVNIRDEEGLIAEVVTTAIRSGATIDHIGDMHDRLLMIVRNDEAKAVESSLKEQWGAVS